MDKLNQQRNAVLGQTLIHVHTTTLE